MGQHSAATIVAIVAAGIYGLISLVGGIIGFVKASSMPSLVAGGISGILLLLCAALTSRYPTPSLGGALIVALALLGWFGRPVLGLAEKEPNTVAYVMTVGGIAVVVTSILALVVFRSSSGS